MKHLSLWRAFFGVFSHLSRRHALAFLCDFLFILLIFLGSVLFLKVEFALAARFQSAGISISSITQPDLASFAAVKQSSILLFVSFVAYILYLILSWTFTRVLIWHLLLEKKINRGLFGFWLRMLPASIVWMLVTLVPFTAVLYYVARVYIAPLFAVTTSVTGYLYVIFLQLLVVLLLILYCHFATFFYYTYFHQPRFRSVGAALVQGVKKLPSFAGPLGILFLFFLVVMIVGSLASALPDTPRTLVSLGALFFFALINRQYYLALLGQKQYL